MSKRKPAARASRPNSDQIAELRYDAFAWMATAHRVAAHIDEEGQAAASHARNSLTRVFQTCLGLSCELYLKVLCAAHNGGYQHGHNLSQLFASLPSDVQERLNSRYRDLSPMKVSALKVAAGVPERPNSSPIESGLGGLLGWLERETGLFGSRYAAERFEAREWTKSLDDHRDWIQLMNVFEPEVATIA